MAFTDKVGAYLQVGATNFLDLSTCVGRRLVLSLHTSMLLDGSEGGPRRMVLLETSILTLLGRRREPQGYPGLVTALVTHLGRREPPSPGATTQVQKRGQGAPGAPVALYLQCLSTSAPFCTSSERQ